MSLLVLATTDQETGIREPSNLPKVTQLGLEWNPGLSGLKTCARSPEPHCSPGDRTFWGWTGSGPSYASAWLSAETSCPRSGQQLLPPSRTQRLRGQTKIYQFFFPLTSGVFDRHAHTHTHIPPPGKGCCILVLPRVPGERGGLCDAVWVLQNLSPSSHLAQADIKIHLHSPRTRLADGGGGGWVRAGGCGQRPSWAWRAPEPSAPPSECSLGPSPSWGHSNCWGTSSPSQPPRGART